MKMVSPEYSEENVVRELLNSSPEFRNFYDTQRTKIARRVIWVENKSLPEGVNARSILDQNQNIHIIELKHVPAAPEDAAKVAEELEHCVTDSEGFPGTSPTTNQYSLLSEALNSMLADPIAILRLQEFGFNLKSDHEREELETRRQLESRQEPTTKVDSVFWMINYASNIIEAQALGIDSTSEFQMWFESRYPIITHRSKKLVEMVERIGFDTPGKQNLLLQEIMRRYKLYPFIRVVNLS